MPDYPGWHAELNGADLPIVSVDRAFIGVVVPAGQGAIHLWYTPRWFWPGAALSCVGLALVGAGLTLGTKRRPSRSWRRWRARVRGQVQ